MRHLHVVLLLMLVVAPLRAQSSTMSLDAAFFEGRWAGAGDKNTPCQLMLRRNGTGVFTGETPAGVHVLVSIQKWEARENMLLVLASDKPVVAGKYADRLMTLQAGGVTCQVSKRHSTPEEARPTPGVTGELEVGKTQGIPAAVRDQVDRALRSRKGGFAACYTSALQRDAGLRGTMRIGFSVDAEGRVLDALVTQDELLDQELGVCITTLVKRIRLPKMGSEMVSASVPLTFQGVEQP